MLHAKTVVKCHLFQGTTRSYSCTIHVVEIGLALAWWSTSQICMPGPIVDNVRKILEAASCQLDKMIGQRQKLLIFSIGQQSSMILISHNPLFYLFLLKIYLIMRIKNQNIDTRLFRSLKRDSSSFICCSPIIKTHIKSPPIFMSKKDRAETDIL